MKGTDNVILFFIDSDSLIFGFGKMTAIFQWFTRIYELCETTGISQKSYKWLHEK